MLRLTISLVSLAMCLPAVAQEFLGDIDPDEPEVRRYTVEVIVFLYAQDVSTGSEIFPRNEPGPAVPPENGDILFAEESPAESAPPTGPLPDIELVRLDRADFQLGGVMNRLKRLDVYRPVMHFGWTQATWPEEQTEAIPLHRLARPPAELDGELTLYLSRFLHLVVDLRLEALQSGSFDGDARTTGGLVREVNAQPQTFYRIQENRILKNGELRYYDHPKFGVLAKITRVEED